MRDWKSNFIRYNGNSINYFYKNGNKRPVILLHGAMDNGLCFSPVGQRLAKNFYVIMPDARGHGQTINSENYISYDLMAQDIITLIQDLNLETTEIIGHSMGGVIAALVASKRPQLINKIVLEDPAIRLKKQSKIIKFLMKLGIKIIIPLLLRGSYEKLVKKCHKRNPTWSDEEINPWVKSKIQFKEKKPKKLLALIDTDIDWETVIQNIQCPILLITSSEGMISDEDAQKIVDLSKDGRWVKIEGAGHSIRREKFEEYMKEIRNFL